MDDTTFDDMRGVIVAVLDKLNQLEALFMQLAHKGEAQAALAEISAYRVTARGLLARIRMAQAEQGGEGEPASPSPPGGTRRPGPAAAAAEVPTHNIGKSETPNPYEEARK